MRLFEKMCFVVLASGLALGQATASNSGSAGSGSVADELRALREAISEQQKQIAQQQQQIQDLQQQLQGQTPGTPHVADAALHAAAPVTVAATVVQETEKPKESPLSFRIGGAEFTPGGFVDFENIFRSTNTGGASATNFGGIPFNNIAAGHLTEFRSTGQYSRYNLKVTAKYGANNVVGYIEGDFNGNDAGNVFVTSNSHTNRLRLYWLDLKRGKWEFLGGNTWGLETPNRVGLSPMPADLALTLGEDANVHVGIPYTRAAEFRAVYHFSDRFQWGFALQNPQQYVGTGEVTFPFVFNGVLGTQFDTNVAGVNNNGTPNAFPDIHTKFAYDTDTNGRHFHFEAGGIMTSVKIALTPIGGTEFVKHTKVGGGLEGAVNYEVVKGFRLLANGMWGNGVGRYMIGLGPQTVIVPIATGPAAFDADISMVHALGGTIGAEATHGKSQFGFYYGGNYFQRNTFPDVTSPLPTKPLIGFGGANVPGANRAIQEASIDWTQTFWKNPQYGAVLLVTQASYLTRAPWFIPKDAITGALLAPKNAHTGMGFLSIRYVLP
jgi:hypothetical protein